MSARFPPSKVICSSTVIDEQPWQDISQLREKSGEPQSGVPHCGEPHRVPDREKPWQLRQCT